MARLFSQKVGNILHSENALLLPSADVFHHREGTSEASYLNVYLSTSAEIEEHRKHYEKNSKKKEAIQSKANRPLAGKWRGYTVNSLNRLCVCVCVCVLGGNDEMMFEMMFELILRLIRN